MFGIDNDFVFICNAEHLKNTNMESLLNKYAPNNHILEIKPHKKGPVFAVEKAYKLIANDEPVIVIIAISHVIGIFNCLKIGLRQTILME